METVVTIISLILLGGLVVAPIFIVRRVNRVKVKYKFITYLAIGIIISLLLIATFAWWTDTSDRMLLARYGYNIDGMNESEVYGRVAPENMERVKSLETSVMGIGWTLKAIISSVVYKPYLLIVYLIAYNNSKGRKKNYT